MAPLTNLSYFFSSASKRSTNLLDGPCGDAAGDVEAVLQDRDLAALVLVMDGPANAQTEVPLVDAIERHAAKDAIELQLLRREVREADA